MIYITLPIQTPTGSNGIANAFCIRIRTGYENDEGLLHHEVDGHVWEWWIITLISAAILTAVAYATQLYGLPNQFWALPAFSLMIQPLLRLVKPYKQWSEVRAYKIQLKYPVDGEPNPYLDKYAGCIANKYGLDVTKEEALRLLS